MYIHNVIEKSKVNGPGTRYVIWFQGCSIRCPGCANKHMWEHDVGKEVVSPEELTLEVFKQMGIDGISITGGEPLDQYEELIAFLEKTYPTVEVFLTSGHTLSEIKNKYPKVLKLVDILIDGPFMQDKVDLTPAWRGSTNQGINLLSEGAQKYKDYKPEFVTEMIFKEDGNMTVTGFNVPNFIKHKR